MAVLEHYALNSPMRARYLDMNGFTRVEIEKNSNEYKMPWTVWLMNGETTGVREKNFKTRRDAKAWTQKYAPDLLKGKKKNPRRKRNSSHLVKLGKGYVVGLKVGRRFGYFTGSSVDTDKSRAHIYGSIEVAEKVGQAVANATGKRVVIREATRTRKRNPSRAGAPQIISGRETFKDTARAAKLFKDFTGEAPGHRERIKVPNLPKVAMAVGSLDGIDYTTVRDGVKERYHHPFKRDARPALAVSPSGKQLLIVGGRYTFTDRGIEDG